VVLRDKGTMMTDAKQKRPQRRFSADDAPDNYLVSLNEAGDLLDRSRVSLYRDIKAGRLRLIKIGNSSRLRLGDIRTLIGEAA
jgi:hypothetical protein